MTLHLNFCNRLILFGIKCDTLQLIFHTAVRMGILRSKLDHITPLLEILKWLQWYLE